MVTAIIIAGSPVFRPISLIAAVGGIGIQFIPRKYQLWAKAFDLKIPLIHEQLDGRFFIGALVKVFGNCPTAPPIGCFLIA